MKILTEVLKLLIIAQIIRLQKADTSWDESTAKQVKFEIDRDVSSNLNHEMANYYISSDFFKNNVDSKYLRDTFNSIIIKSQEVNGSILTTTTTTQNPMEMLKSILEGFITVNSSQTHLENKSAPIMSFPNVFTVTMQPLLTTSLQSINPKLHEPNKATENSTIKAVKNSSSIEEVSYKQSSMDMYKPVFVALAEHCDQMKMTIEELKLKQASLKKENQDLYKKLGDLQTSFMEKLRSQSEMTGKKLDSIKNQQNDEKNYILKVAATLINIEDKLLKENELSLKEIELENILTKTELLQRRYNETTEHSGVITARTERPNVKEYENLLQKFIREQDSKDITHVTKASHVSTMFTKVIDAVTHKPTEVFKSDIAKMISQIVRVHKNNSQEHEKVTEEDIESNGIF